MWACSLGAVPYPGVGSRPHTAWLLSQQPCTLKQVGSPWSLRLHLWVKCRHDRASHGARWGSTTNDHMSGGSQHNTNPWSHSRGGQKSQVQVWAPAGPASGGSRAEPALMSLAAAGSWLAHPCPLSCPGSLSLQPPDGCPVGVPGKTPVRWSGSALKPMEALKR